MRTKKMSLENIQGKLSRTEMKNIMAGSGGAGTCGSNCDLSCKVTCNGSEIDGTCSNKSGRCTCAGVC